MCVANLIESYGITNLLNDATNAYAVLTGSIHLRGKFTKYSGF